MNMRLKLAAALIPLGIIIAAVPENTTKPFRLTATQLLDEVKEGAQFITTDQVARMVIEKDPSLRLIDLRTKDEYDKYHLPGALNIPISEILSAENEDIIHQGTYMNVFYSNGTTMANEAWMLTRQLGYVNNYVMQGGLNYWAETILSPEKPAETSPDDEFARYDFRKAASGALGGGSLEVKTDDAAAAPVPAVQPRKQKKRVAGGC